MYKILSLFKNRGKSQCIQSIIPFPFESRESITQEEKEISTALLAEEKEYPDDVIVATLLHDVGYLLEDPDKMYDLSVNREKIGADFLRNLGFKESVCDLIENHVNTKRYLCTISPLYSENLSGESRKILDYQGGIMSDEEVHDFRNRPNFEMSIDLRILDDLSKYRDIKESNLEYFVSHCERCMKQNLKPIYPNGRCINRW